MQSASPIIRGPQDNEALTGAEMPADATHTPQNIHTPQHTHANIHTQPDTHTPQHTLGHHGLLRSNLVTLEPKGILGASSVIRSLASSTAGEAGDIKGCGHLGRQSGSSSEGNRVTKRPSSSTPASTPCGNETTRSRKAFHSTVLKSRRWKRPKYAPNDE